MDRCDYGTLQTEDEKQEELELEKQEGMNLVSLERTLNSLREVKPTSWFNKLFSTVVSVVAYRDLLKVADQYRSIVYKDRTIIGDLKTNHDLVYKMYTEYVDVASKKNMETTKEIAEYRKSIEILNSEIATLKAMPKDANNLGGKRMFSPEQVIQIRKTNLADATETAVKFNSSTTTIIRILKNQSYKGKQYYGK